MMQLKGSIFAFGLAFAFADLFFAAGSPSAGSLALRFERGVIGELAMRLKFFIFFLALSSPASPELRPRFFDDRGGDAGS